MDDIYEYLKLDHRKVSKLFELYESAPTEKNKLEIVAMLNKELTVHSISEEETFYKLLEQYRESKNEAEHSEKEHYEIRDKLAEIINITHANRTLDKKVEKLKRIVEHHVSEEEGTMFNEAKDVLSDEQACIIKEKMHTLKGKLILEEFAD